ncbi:MAG: hypothetical protein HQM01_03810, partial [Magnetococcales bacterium]|nr:hypothetical protein [Magnetococcales bacterium]
MNLQSDSPEILSAPTCEELIKLINEGLFATEIALRYNFNNPKAIQSIQVRCSELHNNGTLDLLHLIENGSMLRLVGPDFFIAMHFFCAILPELQATPERMMACVEALVTRGGEDLAANRPYGAFLSWCQNDPNRAREVILAAHNGDELASRHVAFALEAIADIAEARKMAIIYDDTRRLAAITALGRIHDLDPAACAETLAVFGTLLAGGADDKLRASMLRATAEILTHSPVFASPDAVALVLRLVENGGDFTIHACAHMLSASRQALPPDIVTGLLKSLIHLNPANKGTVNELDMGLQSLLEHGHEAAAIAFVTELLALPDSRLELNEFDGFIRKLRDGPPESLGRVVVQWLLLGIPRLCKGLDEILQSDDMVGPPIHLSADHLDISPTTQLFLCRKAIGWFFLKPITATSILVSVLRVCDAETTKEVQALLVEYLLLNYHGVCEHLEALPSDDRAKGRVDQALEQYKIHFNAVRAIPPIKELQPSEHHRRIQQLHWSDQMRDAYNKPKNQSVLMSLVKRSVLLYGKSCRTFVKDSMTNM